MTPTLDFMRQAEECIRGVLMSVQPLLLETGGKVAHKLKDDKSAVTEMDTLVEDKLREALARFDGGIPFSGEESGVDYDQSTFWLVDPIDGTEPFIRGLPFATNMIALIHNGQPVMGIINNFGLGEYYLAIQGQGATRNGHRIQVSDRPLNRAFVCVGSTRADATEAFGLSDQLYTKVSAITKFAATGCELVSVASGAIEARVTYQGRAKPWDFAPGALIIQEAGGRVANIGSDTYDFRNTNVIASNAVVFDELMRFMNDIAAQAK